MQLSGAHYNALIYIISFLREVLKHSADNKLTPVQLVLVFSGCIMHTPPGQQPQQQRAPGGSRPTAWTILEHWLTSDEFE